MSEDALAIVLANFASAHEDSVAVIAASLTAAHASMVSVCGSEPAASRRVRELFRHYRDVARREIGQERLG